MRRMHLFHRYTVGERHGEVRGQVHLLFRENRCSLAFLFLSCPPPPLSFSLSCTSKMHTGIKVFFFCFFFVRGINPVFFFFFINGAAEIVLWLRLIGETGTIRECAVTL